jgi:hypothetical protein
MNMMRSVFLQCRHQPPDAVIYAPAHPLANSHRIGKVVLELLDTERQYVRVGFSISFDNQVSP